MTTQAATDAAVTASKAVILADHVKNHRVEYIGLAILAHLLGWLDQGMQYASGVCA
jgi:hypothetical protein